MTDSTIGSGGDYTTIESWADYAPTTLTEVWRGLCLNQEFSESFELSGSTSSASNYKELTTNAGASFIDHASASTNALRYNASNGAAITSSSASQTIFLNENYARITKLQVRNTDTAYGSKVLRVSGTGARVEQCICENASGANVASEPLNIFGTGTVASSLIVQRASGANVIAGLVNGAIAVNCTFVVPSDLTAATNGVGGGYSASTIKNCALFGVSNFYTGTAPTISDCYTDDPSPPSGSTGVTYSTSSGTYFENISDGTHDYRIKAGSSLIDNGTYDATNAPYDIIGTAFGSGTTDVGCWEIYTAPSFKVAWAINSNMVIN